MKNEEDQRVLLKRRITDFKDVLTRSINDSNVVYLVGHKNLDFDAIASLGAMGLICKKLKKSPYIVIDQEEIDRLEKDSKKFYEHEMLEKIKEKFVVINLDDYENNKQENSLLIMLDTNKGFKTPLKNNYDDFSKILIIDHHDTDENTLRVNNKLILNDLSSSCSEIMYWFIKQYKVNPSTNDYYNFLLTGIYLDTDKLTKENTKRSTRDCVAEMEDQGLIDKVKVNAFFNPDFESTKKSYELFNKTKWLTVRYAIAIDDKGVYDHNEVAKAADLTSPFVCEAAIFCGKNKDGAFEVCARSNKGNIDLGYIMGVLNGGGGSLYNASCDPIYVDADDPKKELEDKIKKILYLQLRKDNKEEN